MLDDGEVCTYLFMITSGLCLGCSLLHSSQCRRDKRTWLVFPQLEQDKVLRSLCHSDGHCRCCTDKHKILYSHLQKFKEKKTKSKLQHDFFSYTPVWKKPFLTTVFTVCFYAEARNFNSLTKAITLNITYFLEMWKLSFIVDICDYMNKRTFIFVLYFPHCLRTTAPSHFLSFFFFF